MSRVRTSALTDDLFQRLSGASIESLAAQAIVIATVDAEGWPHPAMLSYYEVAAVDRQNLRLAIYTDSGTCTNMRERGKATLVIVDQNLVCYLRGVVREIVPAMACASFNAMLNLRIDEVLFDEPPPDLEPGAFVTSGITYRPRTGQPLQQPSAVLAELQRGPRP